MLSEPYILSLFLNSLINPVKHEHPLYIFTSEIDIQSIFSCISLHLSSPKPKAQGELIVWDSSRHPCVRESVRP